MKIETQDVKWPRTLFIDDEPRADGLHLGEVISSLMNRTGMGFKGAGFTDMELTAEIGLLWEDVLSYVMGKKYADRPSQIESDGIWMSPDGIGVDPEGEFPITVEEYKATYKSTKSTPDKNFRYMIQVKSYCKVVKTRCAVMRVFHLNGDYKGSGPIYRVSRIVFDEAELTANWKMILDEKHRMETEGSMATPFGKGVQVGK